VDREKLYLQGVQRICDANTDSHSYIYSNPDAEPECDTDGHSHANRYTDADTNSDPDSDCYTHADTNCHTYPYSAYYRACGNAESAIGIDL
jgi:hypothetical protein